MRKIITKAYVVNGYSLRPQFATRSKLRVRTLVTHAVGAPAKGTHCGMPANANKCNQKKHSNNRKPTAKVRYAQCRKQKLRFIVLLTTIPA